MEKINLSKTQKKVLRSISLSDKRPDTIPEPVYAAMVYSLERAGLVRAMYEEGGGVVEARITHLGRAYLAEKQSPSTSINWLVVFSFIFLAIAIAALIKAIIK